jgi:hypothetical protein
VRALRGARGGRATRITVPLAIVAAAIVHGTGTAYADTCTSPASVQPSSLPFTGLRVAQLAAAGLACIAVGAVLLLAPRVIPAGRVRVPRPRPRVAVLLIGAAFLAAVLLIPGRAVASTATGAPCVTTGVVTGPSTVDPPAVVPEAPMAALLPLSALAAATLLVITRRRTAPRRKGTRSVGSGGTSGTSRLE